MCEPQATTLSSPELMKPGQNNVRRVFSAACRVTNVPTWLCSLMEGYATGWKVPLLCLCPPNRPLVRLQQGNYPWKLYSDIYSDSISPTHTSNWVELRHLDLCCEYQTCLTICVGPGTWYFIRFSRSTRWLRSGICPGNKVQMGLKGHLVNVCNQNMFHSNDDSFT